MPLRRPSLFAARLSLALVAGGATVTTSASAATDCHAVMTSTFFQPSFDMFAWSDARYDREFSAMRAVGIKSVILQ